MTEGSLLLLCCLQLNSTNQEVFLYVVKRKTKANKLSIKHKKYAITEKNILNLLLLLKKKMKYYNKTIYPNNRHGIFIERICFEMIINRNL